MHTNEDSFSILEKRVYFDGDYVPLMWISNDIECENIEKVVRFGNVLWNFHTCSGPSMSKLHVVIKVPQMKYFSVWVEYIHLVKNK
jgi:hypothetical protein